MTPTTPGARAALVVAHPAHELRLLGWLTRCQPTVHVLTDGRGRRNLPRIARTANMVRKLGATTGSVFGELTDAAIYGDLLAGRHDELLGTIERLAAAFVADKTDVVVVDAHEDAFLSHDVLNAVTRAAALAAADVTGCSLPVFDYSLEHAPDECPTSLHDASIWIRLDPAQLESKLKAARSYEEVTHEVEEAFQLFGAESFAVECMRPVKDVAMIRRPTDKPIYETHGERMVAEGNYQQVVRYDQHVLPLFEQIANYAPRIVAAEAA